MFDLDEIISMGLKRIDSSGSLSPSSSPRTTTLLIETAIERLQNCTVDDDNLMPDINCNPTTRVTRRKKKKRASEAIAKKFEELYVPTGETLGEGSTGSVQTYRNVITNLEYAVKMIKKADEHIRRKVLKEIELFQICKGNENILQLVEYFEEEDRFCVVFEKMEGGTLLETIERRGSLTEQEASMVIRNIVRALGFLHNKGIAHRDLKPENILCVRSGELTPVKICDFDLGSGVVVNSQDTTPVTTPQLSTPVGSAEFMAPEVVDCWVDQAWSYDKKCDLWSLGIILYIMLCGYPPFYGQCGYDCGWERGEPCNECQDMLFDHIQDGDYRFPEEEWCCVSDSAKDLISHLLVRDPHLRYSASEVLQHPWIAMESPMAPLATPKVLQRNNSIKELDCFAENAVAVNRMILRHLSISEAFEPPSFKVARDGELQGMGGLGESLYNLSEGSSGSDSPLFKMGLDSDFEEGGSGGVGDNDNNKDEAPVLWMALTPPGTSALARRRRNKLANQGSSDSMDSQDSDTSLDTVKATNKALPRVPTAMF